jgi:hypothetical protein
MELTRTLTLLLLLTLSASAQTPRIPPPESVNRNGLVGRWLVPGYQTGNGLTPAKAMDASGNGNHGTTVNSPNYGVIYSRAAMTFTASSSQYVLCAKAALPTGGDVTISLWFQTTNTTAPQVVCSQYADPYPKERIFFELNRTGYGGKVGIFHNGILHYSTQPFSVGKWNHLVFVRSQGYFTIYQNGVVVLSPSATSVGFQQTAFKIGVSATENADYFTGTLCDVRVYNRAWLASEVSAAYRGLQ